MRFHPLLCLALVGAAPLLSPQGSTPSLKPTQSSQAPDPYFLATEGPTGAGNRLDYNEVLALGTVQVGQGPNAGTRVRVTNTGYRPMQLDAPRLLGTNPTDFAVDVDSLSLSVVAESELVQRTAPFLRLASAGGVGQVFAIDARGLASLRPLREVALRDFWLPDLGSVTLVLRRRELPIAPDSKLVVDGVEVAGGLQALSGAMQVWSGQVSGIAGSRVFLVVDASAARGFVELPPEVGETQYIGSAAPGRIQVVAQRHLGALGVQPPTDFCRGQLFAPQERPPFASASTGPPSGTALRVTDCRIAIETDWQLYDKFNSTTLLTNYVTGLVAAASEQFVTDVQTTLSIAYLGVHTLPDDPWTSQENGGDTGDLLEEFRAYWNPTWPAEADLGHFLSGASVGGGIAYVNVLCDHSFGFSVSASLSGTINWSTWSGNPGNFWDFMVFAHELGHNFGSLHTHDYCPPLDRCSDNCNGQNVCTRGTLMSYCHLCPSGVSNVDLRFHPVTANIMRHRVNTSCLEPARVAPGDFVQYRVRFNPLATTGAKSALLDFNHDAPNAPQPFRVQLAGTAN